MENKSVFYSKKDSVGYINLSDAGPGLVLDIQEAQELAEVCERINIEGDVNSVVIRGSGKAFCAGYSWALVNAIMSSGLGLIDSPGEAVAAIKCPVLAELKGAVSGGGLEVALACDIRIASEEATFSLPQILEGSMPVDGGTQRLSRIAGRGKTLEMVLTGETINAKTAFEIGLINKIVGFSDVSTETENLARSIAAKAPFALRYCKEAVNAGSDLTLDQGLRLEADLYFLLHTTYDRTEGVRSFLEKRAPKYQGK
jgi:enoyl-CoA hydratase/carnithine racemase